MYVASYTHHSQNYVHDLSSIALANNLSNGYVRKLQNKTYLHTAEYSQPCCMFLSSTKYTIEYTVGVESICFCFTRHMMDRSTH